MADASGTSPRMAILTLVSALAYYGLATLGWG
jgi:hypothetical protein